MVILGPPSVPIAKRFANKIGGSNIHNVHRVIRDNAASVNVGVPRAAVADWRAHGFGARRASGTRGGGG